MTEYEAQKRIDELQKIYDSAEAEMVELALQFNLRLCLDKGSLLLEDHDWTGKLRGEWFTSTDSCS